MKILFWGHTGFVGTRLRPYLDEAKDFEIIEAQSRLNDLLSVLTEIEHIKPDCIINAAGLTGRPNVDWCEENKESVTNVNVIGSTVLASVCSKKNIHYTYFGTGCIYEYDEEHKIPELVNGEYDMTDIKGFLEEDRPNFEDSFYSKSKTWAEKVISQYPTSLILRIRMPISDDLSERSFITKITKYAKVVDVPNSMSVMSELLPLVPSMIIKSDFGIYNLVNPGVISHNQILDLYKQYIDPEFTYENFSLDEQAKILKSGRSNNYLNTDKLEREYVVPHISEAIHNVFKKIKSG